MPVSIISGQQHDDSPHQTTEADHISDRLWVQAGSACKNHRGGEDERRYCANQEEADGANQEHARIGERSQHIVSHRRADACLLTRQLILDPCLFRRREPIHRARRIGQEPQHQKPDEGRRQSLNQKEPLPSLQVGMTVKAKQLARDSTHDD